MGPTNYIPAIRHIENDDDGEDDDSANMRHSYSDPLNIIARMLYDDECRISFKDNLSN